MQPHCSKPSSSLWCAAACSCMGLPILVLEHYGNQQSGLAGCWLQGSSWVEQVPSQGKAPSLCPWAWVLSPLTAATFSQLNFRITIMSLRHWCPAARAHRFVTACMLQHAWMPFMQAMHCWLTQLCLSAAKPVAVIEQRAGAPNDGPAGRCDLRVDQRVQTDAALLAPGKPACLASASHS